MKPDLIDRAQLVTDLENFKFSLGSVFFMAVVDRVIERVRSMPAHQISNKEECSGGNRNG